MEWSDDEGRCYVALPYVIRERGPIDGVVHWRLDGRGLCIEGTDADVLKIAAEEHQAQHQRVKVGAGAPVQTAPAADVDAYTSELRSLRIATKHLTRIVKTVNPLEVRAIAGSRAALEDVRDDLQLIIERLP